MRKKLMGLISAAVLTLTSVPAATVYAADQTSTGTKDGYDYELWNQNYQGTATMNVGNAGTFSCSWNGILNCLFRTGKKLGSTKTYSEYGGITIDYDVDYYPQGNSYMCVYGWTEDGKGTYPTVEYYIVEAWGSWRPPGSDEVFSTVTVNGHKYDIYRTIRDQQPSIHGTETFYQYWSVRQDNPAVNNSNVNLSGKITVSDHFAAWEKAGLDMSGKLYEVSLNIEGYMSNGSATVNKNALTFGADPDPDPDPDPEPTVNYTAPSGSGSGVTDAFEGSGTDWTGRGTSSYGFTTDFIHGGSKSLYVTGRTGAWNGLSVASEKDLIAGHSYDISAFAGFNSTNYSSLGFTLGMQYDLSDGTHYDNLVDASAASGTWAELATEFDIPSDATNISLYVQTAYTENPTAADLLSFFLDDVVLTDHSAATTTTTTTTSSTSLTTTTTVTDGIQLEVDRPDLYMKPGDEETVQLTVNPPGLENNVEIYGWDSDLIDVSYDPQAQTVTISALQYGDATTVYVSLFGHTAEIHVMVWNNFGVLDPSNLCGDVDCNGVVELADAIALAKGIAGTDGFSLSSQGAINGDINNSGGLDSGDLSTLLQYLSGRLSAL